MTVECLTRKDERKVGTLRAASGNKFLVVYGRTQHAASLQAMERGDKTDQYVYSH